jgi:predicted NAD/FAD-binding protein
VYDHVRLATHGDQALSLIEPEADFEERKILSGFQTSINTAVLHSDLSLMPKRREAWSSWNYITKSSPTTSTNIDAVCLTYNMNILQHIHPGTFGDVLVTLNPLHSPDPATIQGTWTYSHPLYNSAAIRSQSLLPRIQNTRGISYCGAWTKYGFHEDGFTSGLQVAIEHLGAKLPFKIKDSTYSRGKRPVLGIEDLVVRVVVVIVQYGISIFEGVFRIRRGSRSSKSKSKKK